MRVLGLSAFYHDSAAALVEDGRIVAAAQEERFTRRKHDAGFPANAIAYCLSERGIRLGDVDHIAFYDKPLRKFSRLMQTYLSYAPAGYGSFRRAMPLWLGDKLFQRRGLVRAFAAIDPAGRNWDDRLLFAEHHMSHAASAFYPSPFDQAAVLTMDGVGEWTTTSLAVGRGADLRIEREIHFPHSLGLLYSAFTYYCGFKVNSGEYKLMGLAPYGEPRFAKAIRDNLIDLKPDGSFRLALDHFDYCTGLKMTNARFDALFGGPARRPEDKLDQRHMDLAASIQAVLEEAVIALARDAVKTTGLPDLCLAGGVALNCVANGRILRDGAVRNLWIQPAAGDAGGAVGAALAACHQHLHQPRVPVAGRDGMQGSYLGPVYSEDDAAARLTAAGARFIRLNDTVLFDTVAKLLAGGKAVGWMSGRMEFGPRALGGRSILGDPRSPTMQKLLNLKVKYRESFRPFAPAVLREHVGAWFEHEGDSPYMLLVADVQKHLRRAMTAAEEKLFGIDKLNVPRSSIPAVTHVDYSARLQTVHADTNPRFHALLSRFNALTQCPVLVNTSFNVRGEPIVCTPEDAFRCFMGTEIEALAIGNCLLLKDEQDPALKLDYSSAFELD